LRSSRDIIIGCRKAIQSLHRDLIEDAENYIKQASAKLADLYDATSCLYNIMLGEELPDPDTIQTTYSSYLMGLCDVVGELRRGALDFILEGEASKANEYLNHMDKIYDAIMSLDYPSGLIPIKRKQDIARGLIEKTRGELAVASCERRIGDKTHEFRGLLDKVNEKKKIEKKKKETMDIDIDKVW